MSTSKKQKITAVAAKEIAEEGVEEVVFATADDKSKKRAVISSGPPSPSSQEPKPTTLRRVVSAAPQIPAGRGSPVQSPHVNDVLSGRGKRINSHPGNVFFHQLVHDAKPEYQRTKKLHKKPVVEHIVSDIRTLDPPGRFLKEDPHTGLWVEIGDEQALLKAAQALRDDMRAEMHASPAVIPKEEAVENPKELPHAHRVSHTTHATQQHLQDEFLTKDMAHDEVMQWLAFLLPRLQEDDAKKYCKCLMEDGFDSLQMCNEVTEEDLHFMKKGHRRVLLEKREMILAEMHKW